MERSYERRTNRNGMASLRHVSAVCSGNYFSDIRCFIGKVCEMVMGRFMKPYEEVRFPSGIIRWIREGDEYVCRLSEDQMNEIKEFHEEPWVKTYSGGKPNYTQPIEQEPVAYIDVETRNLSWAKPTRWETPTVVKMDKVPLYTAPPKKEWVELTNEEIIEITGVKSTDSDWNVVIVHKWIRAIEAKLKEKNTCLN